MTRDLVLGVDAGTSSVKTGVFTLDGQLLAMESAAYGLSSPTPGAMEQDAEAWWTATADTIRRALARVSGCGEVIGVCIGGQGPTCVGTDADLRPTRPAVTWLDQRPAADAEHIYAGLGRPVPVYGSWIAEAAWLHRTRPARDRTRWYFGCADYLAARLTGEPSVSITIVPTEAAAGDVDSAVLPPYAPPGVQIGRVQCAAAEATDLRLGTPVVAGFVDGILGVLGSGARQPGDACINGGTSGTFSAVCEPPLGATLVGMRIIGGGAINTSGKAVDWFARQVAPPGADLGHLLEEAAVVPPGAGGLLFLPHLSGERSPHRDARARAAWVGLTLEHDRRHMLRAVLEGVAFSFRALQDVVEAHGCSVRDVRSIGGQARSALWNQIKADVLGRSVLVPAVVEAVVTGAAILAARGVGAFSTDQEAVDNMVRIAGCCEPDPERASAYSELFEAYSGLYPALREINWRLS